MQLLTHSRVQAFKRCRKLHFWSYESGLRKDVDAKALRMGTAGHDGLDSMRRSGGDIEKAVRLIHRHYETCPEHIEEYDWLIERETVECLVRGYHWRWADTQIEVRQSEKEFFVPLKNPWTNGKSRNYMLAGKYDGMIVLEDGRLAVQENKFVSDDIGPDSDYWRRMQIDPQISIYVYAARETGWDVDTVLYDVVRKPTIRPEKVALLDEDGLKVVLDESGERVLKANGEPRQTGDSKKGWTLQARPQTPEEWGWKLLADIGERPDFYYARREIARLDSDIHECMAEMWEVAKTLRDAQNQDRWYKTVDLNTCSFCPYFGLCSSRYDPATGDEIPEGFVKADSIHPELEEAKQ